MVSYVKFIRGTQESWNKLTTKDKDTLYFIYENKNSEEGVLYLGDKLISTGSNTLNGIDVTLLKDGEILIYNESTNSWSTKPPLKIIPIMTGATAETDGTSGLVPVPKAGTDNLFLRGDGSWKDPVPSMLKKQVADLVALDAEKSAREIAAEEMKKLEATLTPVTNNLSTRISELENQSNTYISNSVFIKKVGNLNELFNAELENNTLVDAINDLDGRLTWQKII